MLGWIAVAFIVLAMLAFWLAGRTKLLSDASMLASLVGLVSLVAGLSFGAVWVAYSFGVRCAA